MTSRFVIQLDADGYFLCPTEADESPLEPGVFLIPGGAVDAPHPVTPENHLAKWDGSSWIYEEIPTPEPGQVPEAEQAPVTPDPKMNGIEFEGVMCSATLTDQSGLIAVLTAYNLQGEAFHPTRFDFANGSKLVITKENILDFVAVWMPFRQGFFAVDKI